MNTILFALWFFLPAGAANAAPIIAAKLPYLSRWNAPADMGKSFRGKRLFGRHKTWRGFIAGIIVATAVVSIQQAIAQNNDLSFIRPEVYDYLLLSPLLLGFLFGFGALLGDAVESMIKRQNSIAPGGAWFPYDQIDYIIGGCLLIALAVRLSALEYAAVLSTWFILHVVFSYLGYLLKLKPRPI